MLLLLLVADIRFGWLSHAGTGSRGTVVYAGRFEGRPVAVKRLVRCFVMILGDSQYCCLVQVKPFYGADEADKEIALLIGSDSHENVLRYYAKASTAVADRFAVSLTPLCVVMQEEDSDFIYLALERCHMSLTDLVERKHDFYKVMPGLACFILPSFVTSVRWFARLESAAASVWGWR